jgi:hypothetical protein
VDPFIDEDHLDMLLEQFGLTEVGFSAYIVGSFVESFVGSFDWIQSCFK